MKNFEFSPRFILSAILLMLGLIIAAVPKNTTIPYKLSAEQILQELKSNTQYLEPELVAQMVVEKDPTLRLIDIRPADEYDKFSLPGALNIPFDNLLSPEYEEVFNQDVMMNVLYANGNTRANEAWMLLRQLGFRNIYVLKGGLNYWVEVILNPKAPASVSADDELAKYEFRKSASQALGGSSVAPASESSREKPKDAAPKPMPKGKKQAVKGGCS